MQRFITSEVQKGILDLKDAPANIFAHQRNTRVSYLDLSPRARTERKSAAKANWTPRV
jgi:hypothetical protein